MKKLLTLVLGLALSLSTFTTVFANENYPSENEININEFEVLKELSKKSQSELKSRGFSTQEISDIKNCEEVYREHLTEVSELDSEVLKNSIIPMSK